MKLIADNMQAQQVGNFVFSGVRPEKLGSTEYTLVTLVVDKTGSVSGFADELLAMKQAVVEACRKSPRAEFLMIRSVEFNSGVDEEHGFMELSNTDPASYRVPDCYGSTALYDATWNAVAATNEYARILSEQDFGVNGIVFVITDGDDNASAHTPSTIKALAGQGIRNEWLESLNTVLIGVNASQYKNQLTAFQRDGGITQYVEVADATPSKLARLADFVSRSISSQSQSLGTGGASQPLTF
jgi:uncharacterized protein YegL